MQYRETPFGDRVDRYLTYAVLVWVLFFLALLYGTVTGEDNVAQAWLNVGTATALVGGTVAVAGWLGQRRLVARLEDVAPGPRGDRSVIEGRIAEGTGTIAAPVVDDDRVTTRGETGFDGSVDDGGASPALAPDEGAVTRWYTASVVEYVRKLAGRGHKTETVYETARSASPFLVETRTETVDLTDADLSFLQGEREFFESSTVAVEDGDLVLAGWSETLAQGSGSGTRADAGGPTAALLDHATQEADGRLLRDKKYRVRGRR